MCLSCKPKKVWSYMENRMTGDSIRFDRQEVQQLRKKFVKMSGNSQSINLQMFNKNMGILGLQSAQGFSHRLFNSFDIDNDKKISFQDFIEYMQVLKCGNEKNKAKISFKLMDYQNTNKITKKDFRQFLQDFFRSWSSITNLPITTEIKNRTDQYVNLIFKKVQKNTGKNQIDFKYYLEDLYNKDKEFMEAFEFITNGVGNLFLAQNGKKKQENYELRQERKHIVSILDSIELIYNTAFSKQNSISSSFEAVHQQEYPMTVPTFTPKIHKPKYSKQKPINNEILIQGQNIKAPINKPKLDNSSNQHTNCSMDQDCLRLQCIDYKKKLNYLQQKLSALINENAQLKKKSQEIEFEFKQTNNSTIFHKKDGFNNVHIGNSPDLINQRQLPQKQHTKSTTQLFHFRKNSQGNMIFLGDQNWNLVLNMMIGIQMAVRSMAGYTEIIYEEPKDFNLRYYFELVPRRFGDQNYQSTIFSFTDFAPNTFNHIRRIFRIDNEDYINSIGPNRLMAALMLGEMSSMTELTSSGKSGSFFYYTADGKYMLKTIKEREYRFLKSILEDYYYYLKENPKSLMTKFYGLHKLSEKDEKGNIIRKLYFVIMANVFNTKERIVERFDIKGSWFGRQNTDPHPNATKKDNDFKKRKPLMISQEEKQQLLKIIGKDAQFFQQHNIIDYSLLIGVLKTHNFDFRGSDGNRMSGIDGDFGLRETVFYEGRQEKYLFGIIDILTEYDSKKVMEYYFKKLIYGDGISAVPPENYAQRFMRFLQDTVFIPQKMKMMVQKVDRSSFKNVLKQRSVQGRQKIMELSPVSPYEKQKRRQF